MSQVATGSTWGLFIFKNTAVGSTSVHWRQSGTTDDQYVTLASGESTAPIYISLTSAKTIDYYVTGGGSIQCYIVAYGGSAGLTTVTAADVTVWIEMLGYTVSASGNMTTAQVQLCLDKIVAEVDVAASNYLLKAGYAVNTAFKSQITIEGAVAQALYTLRNKGASSGLVQERVIIAAETASQYQAKYEKAINDMTNGLNLGA